MNFKKSDGVEVLKSDGYVWVVPSASLLNVTSAMHYPGFYSTSHYIFPGDES